MKINLQVWNLLLGCESSCLGAKSLSSVWLLIDKMSDPFGIILVSEASVVTGPDTHLKLGDPLANGADILLPRFLFRELTFFCFCKNALVTPPPPNGNKWKHLRERKHISEHEAHFYTFTILWFSSFAQPQNKCLLLLFIEFERTIKWKG
jgi:hypothetical protein